MEGEEVRREKEYNKAFNVLRSELIKEKDVKLTGNSEIDFPEMYEDEIDFDEKTRNYIKKAMIDEIIDYAEVTKNNTITDKRLKRSFFKKIMDALFNQ